MQPSVSIVKSWNGVRLKSLEIVTGAPTLRLGPPVVAPRTQKTAQFIAPHWKLVKPFALLSTDQFRSPSPEPVSCQAFVDQARHGGHPGQAHQ